MLEIYRLVVCAPCPVSLKVWSLSTPSISRLLSWSCFSINDTFRSRRRWKRYRSRWMSSRDCNGRFQSSLSEVSAGSWLTCKKNRFLAILLVTFLGWLCDPFRWLSDLQPGDKKVNLNTWFLQISASRLSF